MNWIRGALGIWIASAPFTCASQASESYCEPAVAVGARVAGCEKNAIFVDAAKHCLEKLNQEEAKLGGKIEESSRLDRGAQKGEINAGEDANSSAFSALKALHAHALIALKQMADYEHYVAIPPLEDAPSLKAIAEQPEGWWRQVSCYSEALEGIQIVRSELNRKAAVYVSRSKEATEHVGQLQGRGAGLEVRNPAAIVTRTGKKVELHQEKKIPLEGHSDITGAKPLQDSL